MKLRTLLPVFAIVTVIGSVVHGVANSNDGKTMSEPKSLPVVTAGVGWTTRSVREASPIMARLPGSFDEWQEAYLNEPVEFQYDDGHVKFVVPRTHTFAIAPNKGVVVSVGVEPNPIYVDDFDAALKVAEVWIDYFDHLPGIRKSTPQTSRYPLSTMTQARKELADVGPLKDFGITLGEWRSGTALYTVIVGQTEVPVRDENTKKDRRALIYKVSIYAVSPLVAEPAKYK